MLLFSPHLELLKINKSSLVLVPRFAVLAGMGVRRDMKGLTLTFCSNQRIREGI